MPLTITHLKNGKYQVKNNTTGKIHSKGTTKKKADKQVRLLNWIDTNVKPIIH